MKSNTEVFNILEALQESGDAFRLGVLNRANEFFVLAIDELVQVLPGLDAQSQVLKANQIIQSLMSAHQHGDYIGLADLLEYQLKPFLEEIDYEPQG